MNRFAVARVAYIVVISTTLSKAKTMFTLAIEDTVEVPVKFTLKVKNVAKFFSFTLTANRLSQDEVEAMVTDNDRKVKDVLKEVVTGWSGQSIVLESTGEPAAFSPESWAAMLNVQGIAGICYVAYLKECGAKEKN